MPSPLFLSIAFSDLRSPSASFDGLLAIFISVQLVGKNVHATIPKGNMGYDQYTVPDTVAVKTSFVPFL